MCKCGDKSCSYNRKYKLEDLEIESKPETQQEVEYPNVIHIDFILKQRIIK